MARTSPDSQSTTRKITLIVLGVVLAGTVFLLPRFVTEPWLAGEANDLAAIPEASPSTVSPSTAAELTRYRQESQGVLAEIVAMRDRLMESKVESWAEIEFQQALTMIEAGDERYSYGDYESSLEQFRQARSRLNDIEKLGRQKLADAKAGAEAAIESLNLNTALASIELASLIAPQDPKVQNLAARVETLAQVAVHIEAGDQALARDRLQAAQAEYRKAVDLDPAHARASKSLALAKREVTASTFRGHMSRGFAALERQDYDGARSAFRAAGRIYPGDDAVAKALAQVDNRESGNFVSRELERAANLESREEWREAVTIYETLLEQDPSLTDARVRLIPARVRADLDKRLVGYIEEPLRLSSELEYRAAQVALEDARGIANPGPRLEGQIADLASLVKVANSPVNVVFRSDNQTHVVLFRVAELGRFDQVSVKLRPGKYVAAGTRSGYRDVRVEFTVTGKSLEEPIVVRCEEPIG
jgi:tetratricopeptide (TPR) repeat protein